ncbi:MAG: hypothetical protein E7Z87_07415 [Cyanobacteria bacterium SIG26]|nr:hypothetical protein [Cyanobacteria bacterium SIG26]
MLLYDIFKFKKKCLHPNVPIDEDIGYCSDCGELIQNKWFITRCSCCGVKHRATIRNDEVVPEEGICHNCGSKMYVVEEIEKIDCININYAIVVREIIKNEITEYTQSWVDVMQTSNYKPKLLQQFQ